MEHRVHEPKAETVGTTRKRTAFDVIENPEPGWSTRRIEQVVSSDRPPVWSVELVNDETAERLTHESESLFVAWARVTERAHMQRIGLLTDMQTEA